jgi:WXG100 family type VII secretion target
MSTDVIQANYDHLDTLASRFRQRAEIVAALHSRVMRGVQALEDGGWAGAGATAFFAEMHGEVHPAVQHLNQAMTVAQAMTLQAKDIIRKAEEEAANLFKGDPGVTAGNTTNGRGASKGNMGATPGTGANGQGASSSQIRDRNSPDKGKQKPWENMKRIVEEAGFTVTSTTGGQHNKGSAHYDGRAIDVRTRDKTNDQINALIDQVKRAGYIVRDERTRPPGQKVWGGPHLHVEAPRPKP